MVGLVVELTAKAESSQIVEEILKKLSDISKSEDGTIIYSVNRLNSSKDKFLLFELYKNSHAKELHMANQEVSAALGELEPLLCEPPSIRMLEQIAGHGVS